MIIQHKLILELADALSRLDGAGDTPYKFGPKTRYALAKNLRLLRSKAEDMDKARVGIVREIWPNGGAVKDTPEFDRFSEQWNVLLNSTEEIPGLMKFQFGELQLDINSIPVTVLANLGPLIIEEGA